MRVEAGDDARRERLVRYCARPPFALERIEMLKDARVAYRLKTPRRGSTHRVMTPVEFLARLAILVPPPYFPLVRYHGVFAARSSWRALVTPKPPDGVVRRRKKPKACSDAPQAGPNEVTPAPPPRAPAPAAASAMPAPAAMPDAPELRAVAVASDDPTMISVEHWRCLLDGQLYAASSRVEWKSFATVFHRELKNAPPANPGVLCELDDEQPNVPGAHDAMVGITLRKYLPRILGPGVPDVADAGAPPSTDAGAP